MSLLRIQQISWALILSISSSLLLSSCSSSCLPTTDVDYIVSTPTKIARPAKPIFEQLNPKVSISSKENFKKVQTNLLLLRNYSNELAKTVEYYELEIDRLNKSKETIERK